MINQAEIHRKTMSGEITERREAVNQLRDNFAALIDKKQAWEDLHRLIMDEDNNVRFVAAESLRAAFPHIPDKEQAWEDFIRLTKDNDDLVAWAVGVSLGSVFPHIPDKKKAWDDLIRLTKDSDVWWAGAESLGSVFPHVPDKKQAWEDLHRLTIDRSSDVRRTAAELLGSAFPHVPDKEQAWNDLIRLTMDGDLSGEETESLRSAFPYISNNERAWNDLIRLTRNTSSDVRRAAAELLDSAFPHVQDKKKAWDDLHRLTMDTNSDVSWAAAELLGSAFPYISNKERAWDDLHRLTMDTNSDVRRAAALALGSTFPHIPEKEQAWDDLIRLTMDMDSEVQLASGESLGSAFPHVPDKKKAWDDLHRLTRHMDSNVRFVAVGSIGSVLPYITDKKQAWEYLHQLTKDEDIYVRESANYSLGKVSIFKATKEESEEDLRKELENALGFFEKSFLETTFNPGRFCYLFYRSFYVMTFKEPSEAEVQKYITKAKSASEGSVSKKKLIEAVENLANALREAKGLRKKRLDIVKCDLNTYRRYCDRAAELMKITKKEAPLATEMLTRGLPIIDKRIKDLIGEIEEKTKNFCLDFSQTPLEKIGKSAYGYIKGLGEVEYPIEVEARLNRLSPLLRSICAILPEESRAVICSQLGEIEEAELNYKVRIIESALSSVQVQISNLQEQLAVRDRWIEYLKDEVLKRLDNINYGVFKLKLRSGEIVPTLREIQTELNRLKTIKTDLKNFGLSLTDLGNVQHHELRTLNEEITRLAGEIEAKVIQRLPETSDIQRVIEKLQDLKQSKGEVWFNRAAALSSIIGLVLTIL